MSATFRAQSRNHLNDFNPWSVLEFMYTEEVEEDEFILETDGKRILVSPRNVMAVERLESVGTETYYSMPRQFYQILCWLEINHAIDARSKVQHVQKHQNCHQCWNNGHTIAGPILVGPLEDGRSHWLCPNHAEQFPVSAIRMIQIER